MIQPKYHFTGIELLQEKAVYQLLDSLGMAYGTSSPKVLASIFSKYYANVATEALYAMTCLNQEMDVSLQSVSLDVNEEGTPVIHMSQKRKHISPLKREEKRTTIIQAIFADHIHKVFNRLSKSTGISTEALWAHTAFSLHYYFEKWIKDAQTDHAQEQIFSDFTFVTKEAEAELFGYTKKNPLHIDFDEVEHPLLSGERFRLRKVCCLRYCLPAGASCTTCPRLDNEARKEALIEYQKVF